MWGYRPRFSRRKNVRAVTKARCSLKVLRSSSERPGCEPSVWSILNRPLTKFLPSSVHSLRASEKNPFLANIARRFAELGVMSVDVQGLGLRR